VPAGSGRESGQWTGGSGGAEQADASVVLVADNDYRPPFVNLNDEERYGHTVRDHVNKTDTELLSETGYWSVPGGQMLHAQEGSFDNMGQASDLVNQTLARNADVVREVASGAEPNATINQRFGFVTGREAYQPPGEENKPYVRPTYEVRVYIVHDAGAASGFRVRTAFPRNRVSGER
jgi:hypothetical protein